MKGKSCKICGREANRKQERICGRCYHASRKRKDPIGYRFYNLKQNAKLRGKEFDLTIEEFRDICKRTGYHKASGTEADNLTIDRIDPTGPYSKENIQVISKSENSTKGATEDKELKKLADREGPAPF